MKKVQVGVTVVFTSKNEDDAREVTSFNDANKYIEDSRFLTEIQGKVIKIPSNASPEEKAFISKIFNLYNINSFKDLLCCDLNVDMEAKGDVEKKIRKAFE